MFSTKQSYPFSNLITGCPATAALGRIDEAVELSPTSRTPVAFVTVSEAVVE
jgi:hypothetical protein